MDIRPSTELSDTEKLLRHALQTRKAAEECMWANIFNSAIKGNEWFKDQAVEPAGGAANYTYLYYIFRALNDMHPRRILEFGLGQSTRLVSQYAAFYKDSHALIVEQSREWYESFRHKFDESNTEMVFLEAASREMTDAEKEHVLKVCAENRHFVFSEGLPKVFPDYSYYVDIENNQRLLSEKYDLVLIDAPGPLNWRQEVFGRRDILSLTGNLADEFVILIHDTDRYAQLVLASDLIDILEKERQVELSYYTKMGFKSTTVIASPKYAYLVTS